jgi:biotin transport system substrate-specific component
MRQDRTSAIQASRTEPLILKVSGAAAFALLMILAAQIRIPLPFTPVPMTLQTFVAPLAGAFLGATWGAASMGLYLLLGLAGLQVFAAASSGIIFFSAPTAGYVLGFILAAAFVGRLTRDSFASSLRILLMLIGSHLLIFLCGVAGLCFNAGMTLQDAIAKGVLPFVVGDLLKIAASYPVLLGLLRYNSKI